MPGAGKRKSISSEAQWLVFVGIVLLWATINVYVFNRHSSDAIIACNGGGDQGGAAAPAATATTTQSSSKSFFTSTTRSSTRGGGGEIARTSRSLHQATHAANNHKKRTAPKHDIAACLLVKDENNRLPEWLAYHYHTMPLRYLSVVIDPNSIVSPMEILQRWNGTEKMGMKIRVWTDDEIFDENHKAYVGPLDWKTHNMSIIWHHHRVRQKFFYGKCMDYYKQIGKKWVLLFDVDEYLVYNKVYPDDRQFFHYMSKHGRQEALNEVRHSSSSSSISSSSNGNNSTKHHHINNIVVKHAISDEEELKIQLTQMEERLLLPNVGDITFADYIHEHRSSPPWNRKDRPCMILPRLQFGPGEDTTTTDPASQSRYVPPDFDAHNFDTLRFFKHGKKASFEDNKYGKPLVDVSRIRKMPYLIKSIHLPFREGCGDDSMGLYNSSLFRVHHYSGSWEAFSAKSDKRRTREMFEARNLNHGVNHDARTWLMGFVRDVGIEKAKYLLKGAGEIGEWKHPSEAQD